RDLYYAVTLPDVAEPGDHWTLEASVVSLTSADFAVSMTSGTTPGCQPAGSGPAKFRGLDMGTYILAVDGPTDGSCGHFTLDLRAIETPSNDLCDHPLSILPFQLSPAVDVVNLDNATNDYVGSCGGTGNDVVYILTVPYRQHVRITVLDPIIGSSSVPVV